MSLQVLKRVNGQRRMAVLSISLHSSCILRLCESRGSFPGEGKSFHCEQEKDEDKNGEIRDGRGK